MSWQQPVYDRTQADIDFANVRITEWITARLNGQVIEVVDLKGCLNLKDISRIEDNIKYLSDVLTKLYYFPDTSCKTWFPDGLPNCSDVGRILNNVSAIIACFYQQNEVPDVPDNMLTFNDVNAVELNLLKIKELVDSMIGSFYKCGSLKSGSSISLPKWKG